MRERGGKITENCPTVPIHYLHRLANFAGPRWAAMSLRFRGACVHVREYMPAAQQRFIGKYRLSHRERARPHDERVNEFTISSNFLVNRRYIYAVLVFTRGQAV